MQLSGNTILITGGTSGIGRALAEQFHRRGNTVVIAGRRKALLDEITAANPGMVGIEVDVTDMASIIDFAVVVRARFPVLNVLINNAGISRPEDLTADDIDMGVATALVQTNVLSVLAITAALLPGLRQQPSATVMATTSGLAFVPFAPFPTYCATKAFLHSWLQSLRFQLRETSVEVIELAPPYVQTELGGARQLSDPHAVPLDDYIAEVMDILNKPLPISGEVLTERVKELRTAEAGGNYDTVYRANNQRG
jgi:uncharacterized oxidoreductase